MPRFAVIFFLFLYAAVSCGKLDRPNSADSSQTKWGHVLFLNPKSKHLINVEKGVPYKVCLSSTFAKAFEGRGLEEEITAAINTWGSYIGRYYDVVFSTAESPMPKIGSNFLLAGSRLNQDCKSQKANLAIGFASLETSVAMTVTAVLSPFIVLSMADDPTRTSPLKFSTLSDIYGRKFSAQEILDLTLSRSERFYLPSTHWITYRAFLHEFGHVFGMCDQYDTSLSQFPIDNCDRKSVSPKPAPKAMMGASRTSSLYLDPDDIEGIRALASKMPFEHGWTGALDLPIQVPAESFKPIESLSIHRIDPPATKLDSGAERHYLPLRLNIVVTEAFSWELQRFDSTKSGWTNWTLAPSEKLGGLDWVNQEFHLNLRLNPEGDLPEQARLKVTLLGTGEVHYSEAYRLQQP